MANLMLSPSYLAKKEEEGKYLELFKGLGKEIAERQAKRKQKSDLEEALQKGFGLSPDQATSYATMAQANPRILQDFVTQQRKEGAAQQWYETRQQQKQASGAPSTGPQEGGGLPQQQPDQYDLALQEIEDLVMSRQLDPTRATQMAQDIRLKQAQAQQKELERKQREKQFETKQDFAEKKEKYRRVEPIINEAQKRDISSRQTLRTTEELRALDDAQNFSSKAQIAFTDFVRDKFGLDLSSYLTPETQAYDALAISLFPALTQNLPPGVRSEKLLSPFKRKLPNLMKSQEGREILYESFDLPAKEDQIYNATIEEILDENQGEVPDNFKSDLRKRFDKRKKKLYSDYKKKLKKVLAQTDDALEPGDIASVDGELSVFEKNGKWRAVSKEGDKIKKIGSRTFRFDPTSGEWEEV